MCMFPLSTYKCYSSGLPSLGVIVKITLVTQNFVIRLSPKVDLRFARTSSNVKPTLFSTATKGPFQQMVKIP